jgi:hypothetical protein
VPIPRGENLALGGEAARGHRMRVHYLTSFIRISTNAVPDLHPPMLGSWCLVLVDHQQGDNVDCSRDPTREAVTRID